MHGRKPDAIGVGHGLAVHAQDVAREQPQFPVHDVNQRDFRLEDARLDGDPGRRTRRDGGHGWPHLHLLHVVLVGHQRRALGGERDRVLNRRLHEGRCGPAGRGRAWPPADCARRLSSSATRAASLVRNLDRSSAVVTKRSARTASTSRMRPTWARPSAFTSRTISVPRDSRRALRTASSPRSGATRKGRPLLTNTTVVRTGSGGQADALGKLAERLAREVVVVVQHLPRTNGQVGATGRDGRARALALPDRLQRRLIPPVDLEGVRERQVQPGGAGADSRQGLNGHAREQVLEHAVHLPLALWRGVEWFPDGNHGRGRRGSCAPRGRATSAASAAAAHRRPQTDARCRVAMAFPLIMPRNAVPEGDIAQPG